MKIGYTTLLLMLATPSAFPYETLYDGLSINTNAVPLVFVETDNPSVGSQWRMPLDGGSLRFDVSTSGFFSTYINPLTLKPDGKVGVGTSNPGAELHLRGEFIPSYMQLAIQSIGSDDRSGISFWNVSGQRTGVLYFGAGDVIFSNEQSGHLRFFAGGGERFRVSSNGNVGIGTTSPNAGLEINRGGSNSLALSLRSSGPGWGSGVQFENTGGGGRKYGIYVDNTADNRWHFVDETEHKNRIVINKHGNVGIGADYPGTTHRLSVSGSIRAKEVVVESNWADYVFEPEYKLPALSEVERHIRSHGRLPGIPSAEDVQANGLSISESQTAMMTKIEELTLYAIEQERRLTAQFTANREKDDRIASLEARLARLESLLNN